MFSKTVLFLSFFLFSTHHHSPTKQELFSYLSLRYFSSIKLLILMRWKKTRTNSFWILFGDAKPFHGEFEGLNIFFHSREGFFKDEKLFFNSFFHLIRTSDREKSDTKKALSSLTFMTQLNVEKYFLLINCSFSFSNLVRVKASLISSSHQKHSKTQIMPRDTQN